MQTILFLVVPCYNEEEVLPETARRLKDTLLSLIGRERVSPQSRILFVDDGSKDATWSMIRDLCAQNKLFSGLKLSRNRGHQNALLAGLMTAKEQADCAISLDADLQDDIAAIEGFLDEYERGAEVVYGVRSKRETDSAFKRLTAEAYYTLLQKMGVELVFNHADYRLLGRRALQALAQYGESNLFLRGIVPQLGFPSATVYYERGERFAGTSKYPLKKMLALAYDGITSFSIRPIRLICALGGVVTGLSFLALLLLVILRLCGMGISGWGFVLAAVCLFGGLQLLCTGVIGEYVGKTYMEVKKRPRYLIEEYIHNQNENRTE